MINETLLALGNVQAATVAGSDTVEAYAGVWSGQKSGAERVLAEAPLSIPAGMDDEFSIQLIRSGRVWILCFDCWHEDFFDRASAVELIRQALAGRVRLGVDRAGGRPVKWVVERLESDGHWIELFVNGVWRFGWSRESERVWLRAPRAGTLEGTSV